jgi:YVTN family beta-propeller protein
MKRLVLAALLAGAPAAAGTLFILQISDYSLGFYDYDTLKLRARVQVNRHPHEFVVSHDRRFAYTADYGELNVETPGRGGNTVSIIDLVERKKVGEIDLGEFRRPHGIVLDRQGRIFVTCEYNSELVVADAKSRKVLRHRPTGGKITHMIAVTPDGNRVYASHIGSGTVTVLDVWKDTKALEIPLEKRPEGIVLSQDGSRLFVANRESNSVSVIDTRTHRVEKRIEVGAGPVRLYLTSDGRTLVVPLLQGKGVQLISTAELRVVKDIRLPERITGMGLSPDGKIGFFSAGFADKVYEVSFEDGKIRREIPTAKEPDPVYLLP